MSSYLNDSKHIAVRLGLFVAGKPQGKIVFASELADDLLNAATAAFTG